MGRISPGPTRWPPGAERRLVPAKSNLKPQTSTCLSLAWVILDWLYFSKKIIFIIKNKQQETLHQQQAAGEAQQTHSVEITIKRSGSKRQTISAYRQQPRAVHPVRRDLSYISKKGEYGHKERGHRREDGA